MSIKLYGGRIAHPKGDNWIEEWQDRLRKAARALTQEAKMRGYNQVLRSAIEMKDRMLLGEEKEGEGSPLSAANTLYTKLVVDPVRQGKASGFDHSANVSWTFHEGKIFCILFSNNDIEAKIERLLELDDYHYQNQADPPEGCTYKEMEARGEVWGNLLCIEKPWDAAPSQVMHTFTLAPEPEFLIWWPSCIPEGLGFPDFDARCKNAANTMAFNEYTASLEGDRNHYREFRAFQSLAAQEGSDVSQRIQHWNAVARNTLPRDIDLEYVREKNDV